MNPLPTSVGQIEFTALRDQRRERRNKTGDKVIRYRERSCDPDKYQTAEAAGSLINMRSEF